MVEDGQRRPSAGHDTLPSMPNRRPQLELVAPAASPEEAAAVVAAVEQFLRDTAPPPPLRPPRDPWQRAAILEQPAASRRADAVGRPAPVGLRRIATEAR